MAVRRRLNTLNLRQKVELIRAVEKGDKKKREIAAEYGTISSTLSTILKNKDRLLKAFENETFEPNRKRLRSANYPELETQLLKWYKVERATNAAQVTGHAIQAKATELAKALGYTNFVCSEGWLGRFKNRHGIALRGKSLPGSTNEAEPFVNAAPIPLQPSPLPQKNPMIEGIRLKEEIPWVWGEKEVNVALATTLLRLENECGGNNTGLLATQETLSSGHQLKELEGNRDGNVAASMAIEWKQQTLLGDSGSGRETVSAEGSEAYFLHNETVQSDDRHEKNEAHDPMLLVATPHVSQCVFVVNSATILYRFLPAKYLELRNAHKYGQKWKFNVFACADLTGSEKLPLLVVGKPKNPCCAEDLGLLPIVYASEEEMPDAFCSWLKNIDIQFQRQQRSVTLFVGNDLPRASVQLKNIKVVSMSAHTTDLLKNSEHSIGKNLSTLYRRRLLQNAIHSLDNGQAFTLGILKALLLLRTAWTKVSKDTIVKCYRLVGDFSQLSRHSPAELSLGLSDSVAKVAASIFSRDKEEEYILPHAVVSSSGETSDEPLSISNGLRRTSL